MDQKNNGMTTVFALPYAKCNWCGMTIKACERTDQQIQIGQLGDVRMTVPLVKVVSVSHPKQLS